jgi:hypothetical protein
MEIITIECMNTKPHDPHTWREGFLWHRKRECGGVPQKVDRFGDMITAYCEADIRYTAAMYETIIETEGHRHYFGFCPDRSDDIVMLWECLDPFCDGVYEKFRMFYNWETLTNKRQVVYKKQKI